MENSTDYAGLVLAFKSFAARHHLVEHSTEREDVGASVSFLPFQLFRGHILERANDGSFLCEVLGHSRQDRRPDAGKLCAGGMPLCQPEAEQLCAGFRHYDIARLKIAMADAAPVGGLQCTRTL